MTGLLGTGQMVMSIPGAERAVVPEEKLREYLLSETHPIGRFKAVFFRSLGFELGHLELLEKGLRAHLTAGVVRKITTEYGRKYEVRGMLTGPSGRSGRVISVWIVPWEQDYPRFVTAYPE